MWYFLETLKLFKIAGIKGMVMRDEAEANHKWSFFFFFLIFWPCRMACETLVP